MTSSKSKFPVPDFPIRGGVLKQAQRNALVRSAMTGEMGAKKVVAKKASAAPKSTRKGK